MGQVVAVRKIELSIEGMSCAACAVRIEKKLNRLGALDRGTAGEGVLRQLSHGSGGGIYLEVAASVTTFLLAGRLYEARARRTAGAAMRELAAAGAKDVCLLETDGTERHVPPARLRPGEMFVVRPGETIAADGEALFGRTAVDRSMMTGESVPAEAAEGGQGRRRDDRADRAPGRAGPQRRAGRMSMAAVHPAGDTGRVTLLRYAGAVEQASEHAVAAAITAAAQAEASPLPQAGRFRALPGLGACGLVDGHEVIVGRAALFAGQGIRVPPELSGPCAAWEQSGWTTVLAGWDGAVRGAVAVADTVKPSAAAAIAELRGLGLHPVLLTGDNEATARAVAAAAGIDGVIAGTLPAGKAAVIRDLQARGRRVAMVGDGVNDAPALAAADLGLALGSGTDVAMSAADLILLRDDLLVVADAIRLARGTFRTIRRNLAWAFGYNLAALPLAALGLLNPIVASAAMTLSSVFVVWNSLRLGRFRVRGAAARRLAGAGRPAQAA